MSTSTLPATKQVVMFSAGTMGVDAESGVKKSFFERGGRKIMKLENVAVFRSGTFRDSIGRQATYTADDMKMFVTNFNNLKANGVFPDVPVRVGHPQFGVSSMSGLIGHVTGMRAEEREASIGKQKFTVLLTDYEILRADAQENIDSGLWKNRSSEVGVYTDNNDVDHAPVFMGFAYVDIPAVERLNEFGKSSDASESPFAFSYITEEIDMTAPNPVATPPAPTAPAPAPVPAAPVEFSIGGAPTTDYAAVQQYITALERQVTEFTNAEAARTTAEREAFVKSLAEGASPKIAATLIDSTTAFAKGLTQEQFTAWKGTMETIAPNPLFQQHGPDAGTVGNAGAPAPQKSAEDSAFETAKAIVTNLSKAGVSAEAIKKGQAYQKVIAKDPAFQLPTATAIN